LYEDALRESGITVTRVAPHDHCPDAVFVEDTAIVLDEIAVTTRPGAEKRRLEVDSVREALAGHRQMASIEAPATLDGGDVLVLGRDVYVGLTARSSLSGLQQLRAILAPLGYEVRGIPVHGCLHLKSAVTRAGAQLLVANPMWVDPGLFTGWEVIPVDFREPHAGNVLWLGASTIVAESFPRTNALLGRRTDSRLVPVPASELAKAEGGVTCCSLLLKTDL
jgi:dimethylargininase